MTKDGLDFLGAQPVINGKFGSVTTATDASLPHWVLQGVATCHDVSKFGDSFVGNQVEVRPLGLDTSISWDGFERLELV